MPRLRRPRAVLAASASLVALALGIGLAGCGLTGTPPISTVGKVDFDRPLAIPPLAPSTIGADGTRVFQLTARAGSTEFLDGLATPTWGFGQGYLGPTLRAARGERVAVEVRNDLDEPTTVHWHGMHLPAAMDGGPHQMVASGETWTPAWTVDQPAATLWYHPHPHGATERHVRNGLAGMFILDDAEEAALPLPRTYGVDDVPLIVQDVAFAADGRIIERDGGFVGALGDRILVNGTLGPYLDVSTELVRLRILNASTARVYAFELSDGDEFTQIASDGGLLAAPLTASRLQLSPGERAEIVVALTPGERVILRSGAPDLGGTLGLFGGSNGGSDRFDVLELRAAATLAPSPDLPAALATIDRLDPVHAAAARDFTLDGTQIDQNRMDLGRIDEVVTVGTTEIWSVTNNMAFPHNFHVHDVQFQILDIAGSPPPAEAAGWKDTVYLRPNETVRLIMRFDDYADAAHPYMYHCHLLRHEDQGMMGQFLVVEPGTTVPADWSTGTMEGESHEH